MRKSCARLSAAALAGAGSLLIASSASHAALTVTWTETPNVMTQDGPLDKYVFNITGISGGDNVKGPAGQDPEVLLFEGTWTASNNGVLLIPGANTSNPGVWTNYIVTPVQEPSSSYKSSSVNLPGLFGTATRSGYGSASTTGGTSAAVTAIHGTSTSFTAHWLENNPATTAGPAGGIEPSVNGGKLATIYVTHGDVVNIQGDYGTYQTVGGQAITSPILFDGGPIEPTHNIVDLANTGQSGAEYGVQLTGIIGQYQTTLNPAGPSAIAINLINGAPGFANNIAFGSGLGAAHVAISGFAAGDQEIYALKLKIGGSAPTLTQISTIVADIGGQSGDGVSTVANLLSPGGNSLAAQIASLFPGYDLMLTVSAGSGSATPYLGFDFGQVENLGTTSVVVTDVAAVVPEPTGTAVLLLGASSLLLGRRKRIA